MTEDSSEKPHDPTPARLEDLRRKGDVPRSQDLGGLAALVGLLLGAATFGEPGLTHMADVMLGFFQSAPAVSPGDAGILAEGKAMDFTVHAVLPTLLVLGVSVGLVILSAVAQRSVVFAPNRIHPKISRISVLKNAKSKFGPTGLFEFAKSFGKMAAFGAALAIMIYVRRDRLFMSMNAEPHAVLRELLDICLDYLLLTVLVAAVFAAVDLLWQRHAFLVKNRMSRKELVDEQKQNEGDPQLKAERRKKAQAISQNKMMADVPRADVVVVNPTHYAVALAWDRDKRGSAPVCVAKGTDAVAAAIREVAAMEGVAIFSDPPTARALFAEIEIGQEIRLEHFHAVAAAIRFADQLRKKGKNR